LKARGAKIVGFRVERQLTYKKLEGGLGRGKGPEYPTPERKNFFLIGGKGNRRRKEQLWQTAGRNGGFWRGRIHLVGRRKVSENSRKGPKS